MERLFVVLHRGKVLLGHEGSPYHPAEPMGARIPHGGGLYVEESETRIHILAWEEDAPTPEGAAYSGLRSILGTLPASELQRLGRARQLLEWRENHRFCGRCGRETRLGPRGSSLTCPECGLDHFPRVAPAVIVLVHDGPRLLLGRSPHLPKGMFSTLAGFVEPGESAEETVHREILEESGVRVTDLRYFGSQPWPFPHSLMLGYHARYVSGELRLDEEELEALDWFTADDLPLIPPRLSIARSLIDAFLEGRVE